MDEPKRDDDRLLLQRSAEGDERAFRDLHGRHASEMRRRARDVLRNRTLAEDAVQEAFLDLWRSAASFDPRRASVRVWLCVLVHRRAVDIARREARRRKLDELPTAVERGSYTAEERLILQVDRRAVRQALDRAEPGQRKLLELAFYGGLTHRELAERLDLPLGTLKTRMRVALAAMRHDLAVGTG